MQPNIIPTYFSLRSNQTSALLFKWWGKKENIVVVH